MNTAKLPEVHMPRKTEYLEEGERGWVYNDAIVVFSDGDVFLTKNIYYVKEKQEGYNIMIYKKEGEFFVYLPFFWEAPYLIPKDSPYGKDILKSEKDYLIPIKEINRLL